MACAARPAPTRSILPPSAPRRGARPRAAARRLRQSRQRPLRFLSGRDTRESGTWIEQELAAGMVGEGAALVSAGVVPTPAIAYLTPRQGFTAGVVISASHNPFGDNGIKVFSGAGEKFTEVLERQVEAMMDDASWSVSPDAASVPAVDYREEYERHLVEILPPASRRAGMKIAWTAPTAPPPRWRRRFSPTSASTPASSASIPMGATSTWTADRRTPRAVAACRRGRLRDGDRVRRRRRSRHLRRREPAQSWTATR
jgi:hypothetical protein